MRLFLGGGGLKGCVQGFSFPHVKRSCGPPCNTYLSFTRGAGPVAAKVTVPLPPAAWLPTGGGGEGGGCNKVVMSSMLPMKKLQPQSKPSSDSNR